MIDLYIRQDATQSYRKVFLYAIKLLARPQDSFSRGRGMGQSPMYLNQKQNRFRHTLEMATGGAEVPVLWDSSPVGSVSGCRKPRRSSGSWNTGAAYRFSELTVTFRYGGEDMPRKPLDRRRELTQRSMVIHKIPHEK